MMHNYLILHVDNNHAHGGPGGCKGEQESGEAWFCHAAAEIVPLALIRVITNGFFCSFANWLLFFIFQVDPVYYLQRLFLLMRLPAERPPWDIFCIADDIHAHCHYPP
ncbi:MAG: hypothetical protein FWD79_04250 [Desulfobulbus sp.]|nr:hypothetical protein [Desulfobulbus sp.]